jgi:hypothetical protein
MCNICASRLKELSKNTPQTIYLSSTRFVLPHWILYSKHTFDILETSPDNREKINYTFDIIETSDDNRERLQAMELFKDIHLVKLELLSNATTIDNALNYIRNRQQRKQQEENIKIDTITTSTTRNQVF